MVAARRDGGRDRQRQRQWANPAFFVRWGSLVEEIPVENPVDAAGTDRGADGLTRQGRRRKGESEGEVRRLERERHSLSGRHDDDDDDGKTNLLE
jgi:hypothetical protein